ncbi:MAG TPA: hypothetical protein VHA70_15940 [Bauldia sp.]|nr:hypothetical protein [Bauldia sp.]
MKTAHQTLALSVAALLTFGTAAMAIEPQPDTTASSSTAGTAQYDMDAQTDQTGFSLFGFDIAVAGNTPAAVQEFIAGLTPAQQHSVDVGCSYAFSDAAMAPNTTVMQFCRNATS